MTELKVAPCTFEAAKYAVLNWHYSKAMPAGKLAKFGVWENGDFIGVILFGRGASPYLLTNYNLEQTEACELVRIAMRKHKAPVSQALAEAIKQLKKSNSGLRLIVSFADPDQGHLGKIYQATNWIYTGTSAEADFLKTPSGRVIHPRTFYAKSDTKGLTRGDVELPIEKVRKPGKHRYLFPLDKKMRKEIMKLSKAYPCEARVKGDSVGVQPIEAGSIPAPRSKKKVVNG